jgi:metal-dependent amidase/aminoacylase/carboxypeptidase family protein
MARVVMQLCRSNQKIQWLRQGMTIMALQTLISRRLDPFDQAVISLTRLDAGSAYNVIPSTATIGGTLRTMKSEIRDQMLAEIEQVASQAASTLGCTVSMELTSRLSANGEIILQMRYLRVTLSVMFWVIMALIPA